MRAVCWEGKKKVQVNTVPDPTILNPRDAIIRVTSTAICGSDLHLYNGRVPTMEPGDILGHEFMGEVVELGAGVRNLNRGDRVVVPFDIACGGCYPCSREEYAAYDNSNPLAPVASTMMAPAGAGAFGFSKLYGQYAGGQAEYVLFPSPMSGRSRFPTVSPTSRCSSSPTFFRRDTRAPTTQ